MSLTAAQSTHTVRGKKYLTFKRYQVIIHDITEYSEKLMYTWRWINTYHHRLYVSTYIPVGKAIFFKTDFTKLATIGESVVLVHLPVEWNMVDSGSYVVKPCREAMS